MAGELVPLPRGRLELRPAVPSASAYARTLAGHLGLDWHPMNSGVILLGAPGIPLCMARWIGEAPITLEALNDLAGQSMLPGHTAGGWCWADVRSGRVNRELSQLFLADPAQHPATQHLTRTRMDRALARQRAENQRLIRTLGYSRPGT